MSIVGAVKEFLTEQKYIKSAEVIDESESLLERGIIDSVGVLNLISFLEETYGINIDEDDLMPENFDSLSAISSYVNRKNGR